jgi:hypothetical protein
MLDPERYFGTLINVPTVPSVVTSGQGETRRAGLENQARLAEKLRIRNSGAIKAMVCRTFVHEFYGA